MPQPTMAAPALTADGLAYREPVERSVQVSLAPNAVRQQFSTRVRRNRWADTVVSRLDEICDLEAGWDGYDAQPVRYSTCDFTKDVLNQLYSDGLPVPNLVPTTSGGVQIEWHGNGRVVEVNIIRPYAVECYYDFTQDGGEEDEFDCKSDYSRIAEILNNFAE